MAQLTPDEYREYIASEWSDTFLYGFYDGEHLLAVAVIDHLNDGLSAVYTSFSPSAAKRSMGTFCVLWQIDEAIRLGKSYVYLGYWIPDSPKMSYKANFQPFQRLTHQVWR